MLLAHGKRRVKCREAWEPLIQKSEVFIPSSTFCLQCISSIVDFHVIYKQHRTFDSPYMTNDNGAPVSNVKNEINKTRKSPTAGTT